MHSDLQRGQSDVEQPGQNAAVFQHWKGWGGVESGVETCICLLLYTLSGRPKEGENTFGPQQARLCINKGLHRDLYHRLLSPGTKSKQSRWPRQLKQTSD